MSKSTNVPRVPTIYLKQGAYFRDIIEIVNDETGAPIDITSWDIRGGVRRLSEKTYDALFACSVFDGPTGQLLIEMTALESAKLSEGMAEANFLFLGPAGSPLPLAVADAETELFGPWPS